MPFIQATGFCRRAILRRGVRGLPYSIHRSRSERHQADGRQGPCPARHEEGGRTDASGKRRSCRERREGTATPGKSATRSSSRPWPAGRPGHARRPNTARYVARISDRSARGGGCVWCRRCVHREVSPKSTPHRVSGTRRSPRKSLHLGERECSTSGATRRSSRSRRRSASTRSAARWAASLWTPRKPASTRTRARSSS